MYPNRFAFFKCFQTCLVFKHRLEDSVGFPVGILWFDVDMDKNLCSKLIVIESEMTNLFGFLLHLLTYVRYLKLTNDSE